MEENAFGTAFDDFVDVFFRKNGFPVDDDFVSFDRYHLAGVFVDEIFHPCFEDTGSQFTTDVPFEVRFRYLHFVCQVEDLEDLSVAFEADGAQKRGDRQFLLPVDVCVHHVVDVRSELDPRTFERDDAG